MACSIDNARPGLLVGERYIAKSVTVTIPVATLVSLTIGISKFIQALQETKNQFTATLSD